MSYMFDGASSFKQEFDTKSRYLLYSFSSRHFLVSVNGAFLKLNTAQNILPKALRLQSFPSGGHVPKHTSPYLPSFPKYRVLLPFFCILFTHTHIKLLLYLILLRTLSSQSFSNRDFPPPLLTPALG